MLIGVLFTLIFNANAELTDIQKAREAFLQEGRKDALKILAKSVRKQKDKTDSKELSEAEKLATRFKTDEAQREFELGESLYFSEQAGSLDKYKNALKLEPDNLTILYAMIRYYLKEGSCSAAKLQLKNARNVWKYAKLQYYYNLKIGECEGKSLDLVKVRNLKKLSPELGSMATVLEIQALVEKGYGKEALKLEKLLEGRDKSFSEIYFWLYKAGELEDGGELGYLRKYLKLCQSYGASERRSFRLEPLLCGRIKQVRAMVSKLESGGV